MSVALERPDRSKNGRQSDEEAHARCGPPCTARDFTVFRPGGWRCLRLCRRRPNPTHHAERRRCRAHRVRSAGASARSGLTADDASRCLQQWILVQPRARAFAPTALAVVWVRRSGTSGAGSALQSGLTSSTGSAREQLPLILVDHIGLPALGGRPIYAVVTMMTFPAMSGYETEIILRSLRRLRDPCCRGASCFSHRWRHRRQR